MSGDNRAMRENLKRLHADQIGWARFLRETQKDWRAMAHFLHKRWPLPDGVEPADVEQELLVSAWQHLQSWTPTGGQPLHRWVTLGAMHAACGWLHKQRNSKGRKGRSPSRLHVRLAAFERDDGASTDPADFLAGMAVDALQLEFVAVRQRIEAKLAACATARDHYAYGAMVAEFGNVGRAAQRLLDDPRSRRALRIEDQAQAVRAIKLADLGR